MTFYEPGQTTLRAESYDKAIKQLVQYAYKMRQLVSVVPSSSWKNNFFREQTSIPTDQPGNAIRGIPRGADFPNAVLSWEKVTTYIEKYGLSGSIDHEDIIAGEIDMRNRTILRIAEGVAKAVDTQIAAVLTEGYSVSNIQSYSINTTAKGGWWNESSAAIIKNLAHFKSMVKTYYDNASNFVCVIHPDREEDVLHYIYEKGAQATTAGQAAFNGQIGSPAGVSIITSSVIDVSHALFLVPQKCATWKQLMPLQTDTESTAFKGDKITACEYGVCELHEPKQVVLCKIIK